MAEHQRAGFVRNERRPVGAAGGGDRRRADTEIDRVTVGIGGVGENVEQVAVVVDAVFKAGGARFDEARLGGRVVGVDEVDFAGLMVGDVDQQVVARLGFAEVHVEGGVVLLVDEFVGVDRCAEDVAMDVERAVVVVEADVVDRLAVAAPDHAAGTLDHVGQVFAGGDAFNRADFLALRLSAEDEA